MFKYDIKCSNCGIVSHHVSSVYSKREYLDVVCRGLKPFCGHCEAEGRFNVLYGLPIDTKRCYSCLEPIDKIMYYVEHEGDKFYCCSYKCAKRYLENRNTINSKNCLIYDSKGPLSRFELMEI